MKKRIQQGTRTKQKVRTKLILSGVAITALFTIAGSLLVFINMSDLRKSRASETGLEGGGSDLNNGEIISEFTWETDPATKATLGPDAISCGKNVHTMNGGRASTGGLSAGAEGNDINMEINGEEIFKQDGIDISLDFRRNEVSGDFFSRGNIFNFGMEDGFIAIQYVTENAMGKKTTVRERTAYEIPSDQVFRNFRFIYTPSKGKAEIFVSNIIVWQKETEKNSALCWKNGGNVIIGRNMNGGGADRPIFDNFVVRSCGAATPLAESLLNFMLEPKEGGVRIHWSTSENENVNYFTIERSENGRDFVNVANVSARPDTLEDEYTYVDNVKEGSQLVYYRLRQTFKNGKFVSHSLSAIKFKSDKGLSIERVNPSTFDNKCDIAYFIPKTGRVWIQLSDEKGKIVSTESFEAPQGKNVHVYKEHKNLNPGTYFLSVIFENKKVSKKVTLI